MNYRGILKAAAVALVTNGTSYLFLPQDLQLELKREGITFSEIAEAAQEAKLLDFARAALFEDAAALQDLDLGGDHITKLAMILRELANIPTLSIVDTPQTEA